MFHDLDGTLTRLLHAAPVAELPELQAADVSFETPDRAFAPGNATVDLFLYEVRENHEIRDPVPVVERVGNTFVRSRPPLRADCSYIVTTWASGGVGAARVAAEHRLLGQALGWVSRFPRIPETYLQGALLSARRVYPLPTMIAQLDPNQHAGDFWAAMGIAPRPAFYLTVTTELPVGFPVEGPLVTAAVVNYQQDAEAGTRETLVDFGGTVRTAVGDPVAGAWVRLDPIGWTATSDADGRFTFTRVVQASGFTLRARALGLGDTSRGVDVPQQSGEYDLQFT
ncbi:Pvc16 family protein [Streptomyces sp. NBC_00005]|uniref:Pvc16 family protein n=1 Tax=Streptomyces sp. NBC_00005 TaxID=2903609 RepID=UPI003255A832